MASTIYMQPYSFYFYRKIKNTEKLRDQKVKNTINNIDGLSLT